MTPAQHPEGIEGMLVATRATPWKAVTELRRLASWPWARLWFALNGVAWRRGWRIYGMPLIQRHRHSSITIGAGFELRSWFSSSPLGVRQRCVLATWGAEAVIQIGDDVGISGATVCAQTRVEIGDRVLIGAGCTVVDTDFHPLSPGRRWRTPSAGRSSPIVIGNDCFIGMHAIILKGSVIGRGSMVGAGSVVAGEIPAGAVVAGNPARIIATLEDAD